MNEEEAYKKFLIRKCGDNWSVWNPLIWDWRHSFTWIEACEYVSKQQQRYFLFQAMV